MAGPSSVQRRLKAAAKGIVADEAVGVCRKSVAKRRALTVSFAAADNRLTPSQSAHSYHGFSMTSESHRRAAAASQILVRSVLLTFAGLLITGCGTGTYNDRYDHRLAELKVSSKYSVLTHDPTDDLPVNFRVPKVFEHSYELKSEDPHDRGKHIAPQILMPPFLINPFGFRRMYEGSNTDKKPFYLYVWMYDAERPKEASGGENAVRNALRAILNDPTADWQAVDADTPDGQTRKWKHLLLKGDQEFEIERSGSLENDRQAGVFDLWLYNAGGWDVMLGWRAPADVWDNLNVGDVKLKDVPVLVAGTIDAPTTAKRNTNAMAVASPVAFTPNVADRGPAPPNTESPATDTEPTATDQPSPAAPQNVKFTSRTYLMGNASDSKLAFSTSFPQEWVERFGVAYLPESLDADRRYHDYIAFLRFPPDSRLGKLLSSNILEQVEKGSNVEAGNFEIGGKKGDYRLVRIDFSGNRRPELDGTYIVHFDNETVVVILYGYDDDRDRFKSAMKSIIDNFRIESVAIGGSGTPPPGVASPEPGRTYIGLSSKDSTHPFSFKFPDGWNQQGMSATPLRAEADDSSDTLGLGVSEVPESISSQQLFRGTHLLANFYNQVHLNRTVEQAPVSVNGVDGVSIITEGESPAKFSHRKLIFYVLRKGPVLLTFQGDFDAAKFDASRPQFEQFVNSFRFENPGGATGAVAATTPAPAQGADATPAGAAGHAVPVPGADASKPADASAPTGPAASNPSAPTDPVASVVSGIAPETDRHRNEKLGFSIRFPVGWIISDSIENSIAQPGEGDLITLALAVQVSKARNVNLKEVMDQFERQGKTNPVRPGAPSGPYTIVERGETRISGQPAAFCVASYTDQGKEYIYVEYILKQDTRFAGINYHVIKDYYPKVKDVLRQSIESFQFDSAQDAGPAASKPVDPSAPTTGPAAGTARPAPQPSGVAGADGAGAVPLKAGRVDVEFPEGVNGSIEFPAGFQHSGKSPDASTAPANGVAAAGSADAPDTIKIEVKKLGQGVVYNELRKQTLNTDAPNGIAKTLEHGTCNVAGRSDAEYFVVSGDDSTNPQQPAGGGNAPKRRRMIFLANVQAKKLAVKIIADVAEANYKSRKDEIKACVKSLKFE
jgi:hypothetical protein